MKTQGYENVNYFDVLLHQSLPEDFVNVYELSQLKEQFLKEEDKDKVNLSYQEIQLKSQSFSTEAAHVML